jgi:hypothetical protein
MAYCHGTLPSTTRVVLALGYFSILFDGNSDDS